MAGFDLQTLEIDDISKAAKQTVRSDVTYDAHTVNTDSPLAGITSKQRARTSEIADVLDIGAGTRCKHCGLLYFLWRATCGSCGKPMEYNLGTRNEEARL